MVGKHEIQGDEMASYVYAGPYVLTECGVGKVVVAARRCPSDCQGAPENTNFCPVCGRPTATFEREREGAVVSVEKLKSEILLHPRHVHFSDRDGRKQVVAWTPADDNRPMPRCPTWSSYYNRFLETITADILAEEKLWIQEKYNAEIAILHRAYGNFRVCWGIIGESA